METCLLFNKLKRAYKISPSRVAQRKRAGPITQRSMDRNHPLLMIFAFIKLDIIYMFYYMLDIMYMLYHMLMHYTCIQIFFFINYLLLLSKTFAISLKVIMSYGLTHFFEKKKPKNTNKLKTIF